MSKRPVSVLLVVHTPQMAFLLLHRVGPHGFWQSVTGSLEAGEDASNAACRELAEETGILTTPGDLRAWRITNRFAIPERWRAAFTAGTTHNTEHLFSLCVTDEIAARLSHEHDCARWVRQPEAARMCWSWTNRDAIRLIAQA